MYDSLESGSAAYAVRAKGQPPVIRDFVEEASARTDTLSFYEGKRKVSRYWYGLGYGSSGLKARHTRFGVL